MLIAVGFFLGFLVGFLCDCSRVLSGISGYFLDCSGERVGRDGERERKKLG